MKNLNCSPFLFTTMQQIFHYNNRIKIKIPFEKVLNSSQFCHCYKSIWNITIHFKFKLISPFIESPKYMGGPSGQNKILDHFSFIILMFAFGGVKLPSQWSDRTLFQKCGSIRRSNWTSPWKKMCILLTGQESTQCTKKGKK